MGALALIASLSLTAQSKAVILTQTQKNQIVQLIDEDAYFTAQYAETFLYGDLNQYYYYFGESAGYTLAVGWSYDFDITHDSQELYDMVNLAAVAYSAIGNQNRDGGYPLIAAYYYGRKDALYDVLTMIP